MDREKIEELVHSIVSDAIDKLREEIDDSINRSEIDCKEYTDQEINRLESQIE